MITKNKSANTSSRPPFPKLRLMGNRVYLKDPIQDMPELKVVLDENTKEARDKEIIKKFNRLEVLAVAKSIDELNPGDIIQVDPSVLAKAQRVPINEHWTAILVSGFDIIHVWED